MTEFFGTFMPSGQTLSDVKNDLEQIYQRQGILDEIEPPATGAKVRVRPIGLLIGRPECKVMKDEILPSIKYIHHRTGNYVDIFLLGYVNPHNHKHKVLMPGESPAEDELFIDSYNAEAFSKIISELEEQTNWQYGGGTELILLYSFAAKIIDRGPLGHDRLDVELDFSSAFTIKLEQSIEAKMIPTAISLIETAVRSAKITDHDYLTDISGHFVLREGKRSILKTIASWLKIDAISLENISSSQLTDLRKNFDAKPPFKFAIARMGK